MSIEVKDKLIESGLASVFGITFVTLLSVVIRYTGISLSVLWLLPIISAFYLILNFNLSGFRDKLGLRKIWEKIGLRYVLPLLTILLGTAAQSTVLFLGGLKIPEGLTFPSLHDTMWNIALSSELFNHFPPENPAIAGVILKNNHYFYPFFLAITRYITGVGIFDLYFRFGPILIAALFGIGLYAVCSIFTKNHYFKALAVFLGYFSGNFAYFLPLIFGANFDWKGNTFFADQPFDQLVNPYSVLGFAFMLFGIYCLSRITQQKNKAFLGFSIIGGLLYGGLYGFKSFGGVVAIFAIIAVTFISVIFYRKKDFLVFAIISIFVFVPVFFLITDPSQASMIWAPGWLLTQLMTDKDKLNLPYFADLENYYKSTKNLLGLFKIKTVEFIIYLVGNLGTRIAGFIYLFVILIRKLFTKDNKQHYILWFVTMTVSGSILIPLFFNLRNSTFNIIQFTPYSLVLLSIVSVLFLEKIYNVLNLRGKKFLGVIIILLFIIFSVPVNIKNFISKLGIPNGVITYEEMDGLTFLQRQTDLQDIVLIDPETFSQDPIYIPAISEHRVYLASPGYANQTGIDATDRLKAIDNFFRTGSREFLEKNHITYIYQLKSNLSVARMTTLREVGAKTVFENSGVIIWKISDASKNI